MQETNKWNEVKMAEWLTHLPATLKIRGSCPSFGEISEIHFSNHTISGAEGRKMVCVKWQEFNLTCNFSSDDWQKITCITKMGRYDEYQTKQLQHTHTHALAHAHALVDG